MVFFMVENQQVKDPFFFFKKKEFRSALLKAEFWWEPKRDLNHLLILWETDPKLSALLPSYVFLRISRATSSPSISYWSFCIYLISAYPDVTCVSGVLLFWSLNYILFTLSNYFKIFPWVVAKFKPMYYKIKSLRFLAPNLCLYHVILHTPT